MLQSEKGLKAVCIFDPAIAAQLKAGGLMEYAQTRDFSIIEKAIDPTDLPTIYHFRRLPRSIKHNLVDVLPSEEGKCCAAFRYGITHIENMRKEDGTRRELTPTGKTPTADSEIRTLTDEELELFYDCERMEIGRYIYEASHFAPWLKKVYRVPPISLETLTLITMSVDANPSTVSPIKDRSSDTTSQDGEVVPPNSQSDESKSDTPTAAPVAGTN